MAFEAGAEADGGNADGDPAELVGDSNNTVKEQSECVMTTTRERKLWIVLGDENWSTYFCSQVHSWPAPMKLEPKHAPAIMLVARTATQGTWFLFNLPKTCGACPALASVNMSREPAKSAWLPAEMTLVIMTALMTLPAARAPVI